MPSEDEMRQFNEAQPKNADGSRLIYSFLNGRGKCGHAVKFGDKVIYWPAQWSGGNGKVLCAECTAKLETQEV